MRIAIAIVVGIVTAFLTVAVVEQLVTLLYPFPPDFDMNRPEDVVRITEVVPTPGLVMVVGGWLLGTIAGGWVARAISRRGWTVWAIAGVMLATCLLNLLMIAHPLFMWVGGMLVPPLGGWIALRLPGWPGKTAGPDAA